MKARKAINMTSDSKSNPSVIKYIQTQLSTDIDLYGAFLKNVKPEFFASDLEEKRYNFFRALKSFANYERYIAIQKQKKKKNLSGSQKRKTRKNKALKNQRIADNRAKMIAKSNPPSTSRFIPVKEEQIEPENSKDFVSKKQETKLSHTQKKVTKKLSVAPSTSEYKKNRSLFKFEQKSTYEYKRKKLEIELAITKHHFNGDLLEFVKLNSISWSKNLRIEAIAICSTLRTRENHRPNKTLAYLLSTFSTESEFLYQALNKENKNQENIFYIFAKHMLIDDFLPLFEILSIEQRNELILKKDINNYSVLSIIFSRHSEKTQLYVIKDIPSTVLCEELCKISGVVGSSDNSMFSIAIRDLSPNIYRVLFEKIINAHPAEKEKIRGFLEINQRQFSLVLLNLGLYQSSINILNTLIFIGIELLNKISPRLSELYRHEGSVEAMLNLFRKIQDAEFVGKNTKIIEWANEQKEFMLARIKSTIILKNLKSIADDKHDQYSQFEISVDLNDLLSLEKSEISDFLMILKQKQQAPQNLNTLKEYISELASVINAKPKDYCLLVQLIACLSHDHYKQFIAIITSILKPSIADLYDKLGDRQRSFILLFLSEHQSPENIILSCQFFGMRFFEIIAKKIVAYIEDENSKKLVYEFFKKICVYQENGISSEILAIKNWAQKQIEILFPVFTVDNNKLGEVVSSNSIFKRRDDLKTEQDFKLSAPVVSR